MVTETTGTLLIEEADENGNILSPSSTQLSDTLDSLTVSYTYDLFNRLISTKTGKKTVSFDYEADGYRHSKSTITPSSEENIVYFYEGDHVAFESDETGKVTAVNHYGKSQYARTIYDEDADSTFYYQFNAYGDVTALIGTDGSTIAKYEYDAFGNLTTQPDVKVNNSITYRGYEYDSETGLYYLNARYYDSETARFLTEDTYRGEKNDPLSLNLYTYCKNNPLKYVDPTGHDSVDLGYVAGNSTESKSEGKIAKSKGVKKLINGVGKVAFGIALGVAGAIIITGSGGTATPLAFAIISTAGSYATLCGASDFYEGVDELRQYLKKEYDALPYNFVKDEIYGGDELKYRLSEGGSVLVGAGTSVYGDTVIQSTYSLLEKLIDKCKDSLAAFVDHFSEKSVDYWEEINNLSPNKISHIINGSSNSNHRWDELVPDLNWTDISNIINEVMVKGTESSYKSVFSKTLEIGGYIVQVTYNKLTDGSIRISDAWVKPL